MRWTITAPARPRDGLRTALGTAALLFSFGSAQAGLGEIKAFVSADRTAVARSTIQSMPAYDRTETTDADGTTVREFSARDGKVFAVDFSGPTMPDLKAVLGTHYDSYVAAAKARRGSHHVVSFATDDAVITIVKLPRGFSGHAHVPAAVPAGVDVQTLR